MFVLVVLPKETWKPLGRVFGDDPTDRYHPGPLARSLEVYKEASMSNPYPT